MVKYQIFLLPLLLQMALLQPVRVSADSSSPLSGVEPDAGAIVCQGNDFTLSSPDCLVLGPARQVADAAEAGIPYPPRPLPAFTPAAELNDVPYRYFKVNDNGVPLYQSLSDAQENNPSQSLSPGFLYVSYIDSADGFYQLRSGAWIPALGGRAALPIFQGVQFSSQPQNAFGWVLGQTTARTTPGYNAAETDRTYYRYNLVQIYDLLEANGNTWLLVGPNEWLDQHQVARVEPRSTPPEGIPGSRWIDINLNEQTLAVYDQDRLIFATLISSGVDPFWTRPGIFQIYEKKDVETMSGATTADRSDYYYLEDVPWTMYFDEKRAFHGEYWHTGLGYVRSHGCVNLSIGDSHWLYDWASLGEYVYVYDPSGTTPTDSSLYGSGAP